MPSGKPRVSQRGRKEKGAKFEREVAEYLNEKLGLSSRRALLSGGGRNDGGADLDDTPGVHFELKRTETFKPYDAMRQAEEAVKKARDKTVAPVVVNRRNTMSVGESLVVMRLDDWLKYYEAALKSAT